MAVEIDTKWSKPHQKYRLADGTVVPGTTTVLGVVNKPYLITWANKMGLDGIDTNKYVDVLARAGTLSHEMIQHDLGGEEPDFDDYSSKEIILATNSFNGYLEWKERNVFAVNTIGIELQLVSEKHGFGGTIDWLGEINGVLTLVDIKTSKDIYPEHMFQIGGYSILLSENGYNVNDRMILNPGRVEGDSVRTRHIGGDKLIRSQDVFLSALGLFNAKKMFDSDEEQWVPKPRKTKEKKNAQE